MCAYRGDDRRRYTSANYYGYDGPDDTSPSSSTGGGVVQAGNSRAGSSTGSGVTRDPERSYRDRVNQIVRAFYWKAALVIVQTRMTVPPCIGKAGRINKWFNIELDDMDLFKEELNPWRFCDAFDPKPPPVIIETYIDTSDLAPLQALVILDQKGKRWNVSEALGAAANRTRAEMGPRKSVDKAQHQIVLERWRIELCPPYDTGARQELPAVYKKCIILFRELYSYISLMPTWKFRRRLSKPKLQPSALKVLCRVVGAEELDSRGRRSGLDTLRLPLCEDPGNTVETYGFGKVETPAGYFSISVQYRENCDFRVDDSEALLSSQFINSDEHRHRELSVRAPPTPSSFARIHQRTSSQPLNYRDPSSGTPSSLPGPQPYGSLSTYHQGNHSASPISALRAAAEYADRQAGGTPSSNSSAAPGLHTMGSQASLRSIAGATASRRGSITFMQPFKSPSLSSSPAVADAAFRPSTAERGSTTSSMPARPHRLSVGTSTPSPGSTQPVPGAGATSSSPADLRPQPMARITSSFGTRQPRTSTGTTANDDASSSGQASYASIPGTSSYDDDLQIRNFMTLITDSQKRPPSFVSPGHTNTTTSTSSFSSSPNSLERKLQQRPASAVNPLAKFQKIQESQHQLADSLSSSLMIMSSSQRLVNPHSPAVPSRLSEGLSASNNSPTMTAASSPGKHHVSSSPRLASPRLQSIQQGKIASTASPSTAVGTSPRDIPLSPRPKMGRSNSVSLHHQHAVDAELPTTSYDSARNMSAVRLPLEFSASGGGTGSASGQGPGGGSVDSSSTGEASTGAVGSSSGNTGPGIIGPLGDGRGGFGRRGSGRPGTDRRTPSWSRGGLEDEDLVFAMSDDGTGSGTTGRMSIDGNVSARGGFGQQLGRYGR